MDALGAYLAHRFGASELTSEERAAGASRSYRVHESADYSPLPVSGQGDYTDPHSPQGFTQDSEMAGRLEDQLAFLESQGVYIGSDAFGAPGWMPAPLAPYWDRAANLLRDMGENTVAGYSYLARLPAQTYQAGKDALGTIGDLAARGATRAATEVQNKSRELQGKFAEYQAKKAEFDRKIERIAATNPARADQLQQETYGSMAGAKAAFLRASSQFAAASGAMSEKTISIIRRLRSEATTETLSGEDFGDAGVISVPSGIAIASSVAAVVVIVASIWLITTLVRDLTIGTQQADQTLFEQERLRALEDGASEDEATDRALETVRTLGEGRFNINAALPWVFGIAAVAVGLPTIYKVVKDLRE